MTLTEFLTARLDEDEAWPGCPGDGEYKGCGDCGDRMDREVEAKRAILTHNYVGLNALRHLAAVYAEHPDYREEWRP